LPSLSSNQKAALALCPAGKIAPLSFKEIPKTLDLKLLANLIMESYEYSVAAL
jgi:hypothetical protein